jgi:Protein of unknown function (DUF2796)
MNELSKDQQHLQRETAMKKHVLFIASALLLPVMAWAGKAHEHGSVKLNVSIEGQQLTIALESPLDGIVGFERAPKNAAEKAKVDAAVAQLQAAEKLFKVDAAAACSLSKTTLMAPVIGVGVAAPVADKSGHGDLDGEFVFDCQDASKVRQIEVGLFDAFPGMKRIDVQAATAAGQIKRTLRRSAQAGPSTLLLTRDK